MIKSYSANEAEFALLVSDEIQRQGLGTELLRRLVEIGRTEKLSRITADILPENRAMQHICEKLGFRLQHLYEEGIIKAEITL